MIDLMIYVSKVEDTDIERWINRFTDAGMQVEIHPEFSFLEHSGFLPFKVNIDCAQDSRFYGRSFLSGFEMYIEDYNFELKKKEIQPKKSFLKSLFKAKDTNISLVSPEIDNSLKQCTKEITISFGIQDTFEFRMGLLSSAILCEIFNGVCYDPNSGEWYKAEGLFNKCLKDIGDYESMLKDSDWKLHEFEKWM